MRIANPSRLPLLCLISFVALSLAACGGDVSVGTRAAEADAGEFVVERSEADGVETVRNVSGSRWNSARLVEELAIGEEIGDDPYLFGSISNAWATADRIYVVDTQVPAVRVFDHQGNFLHQVGRPGQGPGEYSAPVGLAITDDGNVLITDLQNARLSVFDADGSTVDDWSLGSPMAALGLQVSNDGDLYTRVIEMPERTDFTTTVEMREGMQAVGPDGNTGDPMFPPEIEYEPPTVDLDMGGNTMTLAILPFTPAFEWAFSPGGEMIGGVGNEYRFEIHAPDGAITVVEKFWDPVAVNPDELDFRADMALTNLRGMAPDADIPTSDIPEHKAAFNRFYADRSGRVWVVRQGPSELDPNCRELTGGSGMVMMMRSDGGTSVSTDPGADNDYDGDCWVNTYVFDVFEIATGEFLGSVQAPELGVTRPLFVEDDTVLVTVTDEMGIVRLKKYRLVID